MLIVFGSINVDLIMKVARLPQREETVPSSTYLLRPGGKGANQAVAAARAGAEVRMVGRVGSDPFADLSMAALRANRIDVSAVEAVADSATGCAAICVEPQGSNFIAVAVGANLSARESQVPDAWLGEGSTVLTQMEVAPDQNWTLIERAAARGARTMLNLAPFFPVPDQVLAKVDVLVVNEGEAAQLGQHLGLAETTPEDLARQLAFRHGRTVIVTLGEKGSLCAVPANLFQVDAFPIEAVDSTGAGDAFCGNLAAALDERLPLLEAVRRANIAGAIACLAMGAQESLPRRQTLEQWIPQAPKPRRI